MLLEDPIHQSDELYDHKDNVEMIWSGIITDSEEYDNKYSNLITNLSFNKKSLLVFKFTISLNKVALLKQNYFGFSLFIDDMFYI